MSEVNHLQHEKEQLLVCIRREERRRRDALRDLQRAIDEKDATEKELLKNQQELSHLKEAYRKHLGNILEGENIPFAQTPRSGNNGASEVSDLTWQAMSESYISTEKKLMSELEEKNNSVRQATAAIRKLYDHYR